MPHTNTWNNNGLYRQFTGNISGDEILESNFELHQNPEFHTIGYIINDFTQITGHSISLTHTTAYAKTDEIISNTKGRLKIAIVINQEALLVLAESYAAMMEGKLFECKIFGALEFAREWVNS